ncbi:hypothetical protein [Stackebrandtia nassauensis]|uniref:Uncharacterized protein n=1 Tax=Stackebrandtia nassauensis (strain DSM 44728 / CIP 108903 / NRRL B-16338 / NBRC 102104 / LLR-40K-21) TaxID=446470 RepID=D3Q1W6_STANL|nr:hypothetical protein [Stackebrandtia nassauensis]ADD41833.1 hypothetical protein Snas_2139 [Stackebrandtia nassauensis DSM 44728]
MNDIPSDVTAVELNELWRVANIHFPKVENVYWEQIKAVHEVNGDPNDEKFGRCHPWWTAVACELERALFSSVGSLASAASALNRAVDAYAHVDGNSGKELTEVGKGLENIIKSEGSEPVDWTPPKDYQGPNFNQPDSWSEEHADD